MVPEHLPIEKLSALEISRRPDVHFGVSFSGVSQIKQKAQQPTTSARLYGDRALLMEALAG